MQWLLALFGAGSSGSGSQYSATWIGIDGFNNSSLIQTGTGQDSVNGQAQYYAWWEILPAAETQIDPALYPVQPGDVVTASIAQTSSGTWTIQLNNQTQHWTFVKSGLSYSGPQSSVEWIEEAPAINGQVATLANYGQTAFRSLTVNGSNPSLQIQNGGVMVQNQIQVSTPSTPSTTGNAFAIAYGSASPKAPSV